MQGVEVLVRHVHDDRGLSIGEVPFQHLNKIMSDLRSMGLTHKDGSWMEPVSGVLVYDPDNSPNNIYFEVLVE